MTDPTDIRQVKIPTVAVDADGPYSMCAGDENRL